MIDECTCPGPFPEVDHEVSCPASLYQAGIQRGREEILSLVRPVWPISELDSAYIPTCRYCGSQRGTPDGEEFEHKETCSWLRLKNALRV